MKNDSFTHQSIPGTILDGALQIGSFFSAVHQEEVILFTVTDWRGMRLFGLLNLQGQIVQVDAWLDADPEGPDERVKVGEFWARSAS